MTKTLRWIRTLVLKNFGWKVVSLAIAVAIWALVASEPELTTFTTVRLEYKNLPEDLEISSATVDSMRLELRGPSGELRTLGTNGGVHPAVVLDMSRVQPGVRTFMLDPESVKLTRGVRLVRTIPSEVRYHFEPRSERIVPVAVRFAGEGQNGYTIAFSSVDPPELKIVGPASRVARFREASTDPVDVTGVVGSAEFRVNAFVEDPYVRFETPPQVRVTVSMKKQ